MGQMSNQQHNRNNNNNAGGNGSMNRINRSRNSCGNNERCDNNSHGSGSNNSNNCNTCRFIQANIPDHMRSNVTRYYCWSHAYDCNYNVMACTYQFMCDQPNATPHLGTNCSPRNNKRTIAQSQAGLIGQTRATQLATGENRAGG